MREKEMKNLCAECDTVSAAKGINAAAFREKITHRVAEIENVDLLEFVSNMLDAFREKWGYDIWTIGRTLSA